MSAVQTAIAQSTRLSEDLKLTPNDMSNYSSKAESSVLKPPRLVGKAAIFGRSFVICPIEVSISCWRPGTPIRRGPHCARWRYVRVFCTTQGLTGPRPSAITNLRWRIQYGDRLAKCSKHAGKHAVS